MLTLCVPPLCIHNLHYIHPFLSLYFSVLSPSAVVATLRPEEDEEEEEEVPACKRPWIWEKKDITVQPLLEYRHERLQLIKEPYEYFSMFFTKELMEHSLPE